MVRDFWIQQKKKGQPIPCSLKQQIGSCCHAGRMDWPILFPFINK